MINAYLALDHTYGFLQDDEEFIDDLIYSYLALKRPKIHRSSALFRKRWDSEYLLNLAVSEGSFVSEYRLSPRCFDELIRYLEPSLRVNEEMAALAMSRCRSERINTSSRVASALILLAGGRVIEAMRTHGLSQSTCYANFKRVVRAINSCAELEIKYENSLYALQSRAEDFQMKSTHGLFEFMTGAIDGLAITIKAPRRRDAINQTKWRSGSKQKYCFNMQGVCDANCLFIAVSCKHAGSTNDVQAMII
jgi:hypothetical protein